MSIALRIQLGEVSFGVSQGRCVASEQMPRTHLGTLVCPCGSGVAPPRLVCMLPFCTRAWAPRDQAFCFCREVDMTVVFFIRIDFRISGVICFPNSFSAFVLI